MDVDDFITRWTAREGGAERANYQMFLAELCRVLGVQEPQPAGAETSLNDYVFERAVRPRASDGGTAPKRIDLYKKDTFILEAKQSRLPGARTPSRHRRACSRSRTWRRWGAHAGAGVGYRGRPLSISAGALCVGYVSVYSSTLG